MCSKYINTLTYSVSEIKGALFGGSLLSIHIGRVQGENEQNETLFSDTDIITPNLSYPFCHVKLQGEADIFLLGVVSSSWVDLYSDTRHFSAGGKNINTIINIR